MSEQDKQTTEIEQGEDTFTLSSMQTPDSNSMRNKWLSSVALTVLLSIALAVTTLAIGYSLAEVPNNTFRTGTIKLNLNDGRPVIQRTVRYEPGATIQSTFTLSNEGTWEVYYKLYFSEIHGDLAKILDVTIAEQNGNTLYQGKMEDLIRRNVRVSDSRLAVGQCKTFTIKLHFPEQSGNRYQDTDLTFLLCADAVQTKNNPTALFS